MAALPPLIAGIADAAVDAAVVVDLQLNMLHFNRAFAKLTGMRPRELEAGKHTGVCHSIVGLQSCDGGSCIALRAIETRRPVRMDEVGTTRAEMKDLRLIVTAIPLLDDAGAPFAVLETYRDVTAESRMQSRYKELLEVERGQKELLQEEVRLRTRELESAVSELRETNATLEQLAVRDGLTGLYNHRSFQQRLREEIARSQRQGACLSLVLADVDNFKRVNDRFGHPAGDAVLRFVSRVLEGAAPEAPPARRSDLVARYGGEEFALILVDTPKEGAAVRVERLRQAFHVTASPAVLDGMRLTVSFGVASFPDDSEEASDLIGKADEALLRAKKEGRDRAVVWASVPATAAIAPVRLVDSFHEAHAMLTASLKSDRLISLISLQLIDLSRMERHYGHTGARAAAEAFSRIVVRESEQLVPIERLLAMVGADPEKIQVFLRHPRASQLGPGYLEKVSERIAARVETSLRDELAALGLGLARVVSGHATHLHSAATPLERQVERLCQYAEAQALVSADVRRARDKLAIQRLILDESIESWTQPILGKKGEIIGWEALARGPERTALESPVVMLDLAEDVELLLELDLGMARAAFAAFHELPDQDALCFLNLLPTTICNPTFVTDMLPSLAESAGIEPRRIVLELSERQSPDQDQFAAALKGLRERGFVLGLDDVGTQNANLAEIAAFRPEWLKLDRSLVRGLHVDPLKRDLIAALVAFAHRQESRVVAEGIEEEAEFEVLRALDLDGFQGYLFGRPAKTAKAKRS